MSFEIPKKIEVFGVDIKKHQLRYHHKRVVVCKQFTFDSAHHLHCYEGKCKNLHGHTYKLQVMISGYTDERGIVIDFADLKELVKERIIDPLDHRYLNEVLPPMNTTAENMVVWMYEQIHAALAYYNKEQKLRLEELRLWETPTSFAMITRSMMEEGENE